ncbi:hypothetical protein ANO11243_077120 [Dothideomycetidae sp. 11243]|nr:hypothetical protein ANO11243_077120 [fungal sp. No.11243]
MARLNEAPIQTESVEARSSSLDVALLEVGWTNAATVKRRFIRQNRDLVRTNTSQSLRIRSLEVEQSRLQTENLCLREEVLHLRNQLSDHLNGAQVTELGRVKNELERQLAAIGGMVAELSRFQRTGEEQRRAIDPSSWRPPVPNLRLAGQELRMPPIVEDKLYPRRTLGSEEIRALRLSDHSTDSPDLGPPPVSRFDYADPIKFDREQFKSAPATCEDEEGPIEIPAELAINLETRRKRRETTLIQMGAEDKPLDTVSGPTTSAVAPRASAKRKLSIRDHEEIVPVAPAEPFTFTRRVPSISSLNGTEFESKDCINVSSDQKDPREQPKVPKERKVLGEKSVNMSPRKIVVGKKPTRGIPKPSPDTIELTDVAKTRIRRPKSTTIIPPAAVKGIDEAPIQANEEESLPPKTPSAAELFSPSISEPSSITHDQPHDAVTTANLEGIRRPSRRARAVTSYAEPSLNTKMRRPSQALVDAVYIPKNGTGPDTSKRASTGLVKREPTDDEDDNDDWKTLLAAASTSPLRAKTERLATPPHSSGAGAAIAALARHSQDALADRVRELRIADAEKPLVPAPSRRRSAIASRRHSSVISGAEAKEALSSSPSTRTEGSSPPAPVEPDLGVEAKLALRAGRRRSMMV